jgi:hypothetical protein
MDYLLHEVPQYIGGTIKCVRQANTLVVGRDTQWAYFKKENQRLSFAIDCLEELAEVRSLSMHEIDLKSQTNAHIARLIRKEELKWYQCSKAQFILEGDSNTRYFHSVTNGRYKHETYSFSCWGWVIVWGPKATKVVHYKLLQRFVRCEDNISMDDTQKDRIPHVSIEENNPFIAPYSEEES